MSFAIEEGVFTINLTAITTVALALLMLLLGQAIKKRVKFFQKYCIPAPVIGGVIFAVVHLVMYQTGIVNINMDTSYQTDMQNLFFTCVGFGITFSLAKKGGSRLIKYFIMAALLAVIQGGVGVGVAKLVHAEEWLGLMCGPAALSGGHGNAAAYGGILDGMGHSATVVGMAAATFGLVTGGFFGGPLAECLITKYKLVKKSNSEEDTMADNFANQKVESGIINAHEIFKHVALLSTLLAFGLLIQFGLKQLFDLSIPSYAGSALLACIVANVNEKKQFFKVNSRIMAETSDFTLGVFLSLAMISLKLWQLIDLAIPMIAILVVNLAVTLAFLYFVVFRICGKDFDAAIMCAGMAGHGLGASPTGFANMDSVTHKYGESKISYLCVTVVGGILMDWVLLVLNTAMVSIFG